MYVGQRCHAQLCSPPYCTVNGSATIRGAVLTVTVANGTKVLCKDVRTLDLQSKVEGGDRQVTVSSQLYVLNGL